MLNSFDLIPIANAFGNTIVLPSLPPEALTMLISTDVEGWLTEAQRMGLTDPAYLRCTAMLEHIFLVHIKRKCKARRETEFFLENSVSVARFLNMSDLLLYN